MQTSGRARLVVILGAWVKDASGQAYSPLALLVELVTPLTACTTREVRRARLTCTEFFATLARA